MHFAIKKFSKKLALAIAAVPLITLATAGSASGAAIYSNLLPNNGPNGPRGDLSTNTTDGALLDDVLVDNLVYNPLQQPLLIRSVTFGILQLPGAPSVRVNGFLGSITADNLNNPVTPIGSVVIPGNPSLTSRVVTPATIVLAPAVTITANQTDQPSFSEFAAGLRLTDPSTGLQSTSQNNSWAIALMGLVDANIDRAYDVNLTTNTNAAYALSDPITGNPIYTTFALAIEGQAVPEPTVGALLCGAGMLVASRRRRT